MKNLQFNIFRRFAILIFLLITVMGILFIAITYLATKFYHEASTELLNKDVAAHIAKFTSPFTASGISKEKADSVFQDAMVLSPAAEVYFLDTAGKVLYYHASEKDIKEWNIDLNSIAVYIDAEGQKYIKGTDPKDPDTRKIFSAAAVTHNDKKLGYIYVILDSSKSENIMEHLFDSHVLKLATRAFVIIIILSIIFSLLYLKRLSRKFDAMIAVLKKFESGDYSARFETRKDDELRPVTDAFNKMADLLSSSIGKLTKSDVERKNFIATISHDLRTPLSIARGYVETIMFKKTATKEEYDQYTQLIYNKILQIENMVKQLFELSKMESVEFKPAKEPFVFSEIVQEAVDHFQLLAARKNIRLHCSQCIHHVWINADISMIERVIQNLLENALKNTEAGGFVEITIETSSERVLCKVENNGTPLSPEIISWINSFNEGINLLERRPSKTGLGLLIVQKILQLHQTFLTVDQNNTRNVFGFSLPTHKFL